MTSNEKMIMDKILDGSNFNFCSIDITKAWSEQRLERGEYWAFADVKDYGCGLAKQAVRGVFGSLAKKGMIEIVDDDDVDWIHINERMFNNIKKEYAGA